MSNAGKLLRQQKAQARTYTFTREQLEEHDRNQIAAYVKSREQEAKKEDAKRDAHIDKQWEENAAAVMRYILSVSCRVLIDDFGWSPPNTGGRKIKRYADALIDKVNEISHNKRGFLEYAQETNDLYGIEFGLEEGE